MILRMPHLPEGCKLVEHEIVIVVECSFEKSSDVIKEYFVLGWHYTGSGPKPTGIGTGSTTTAHLCFARPVDPDDHFSGAGDCTEENP